MWVARDKNNELHLYIRKPYRDRFDNWGIDPSDEELKLLHGLKDYEMVIGDFMVLDEKLFPNLKWEDEPIEVEILPKGHFSAIYQDLQLAENLLREK